MFDMLTSPYTHPLKKLIWMRMKAGARAVWETISGNPVSFTARNAPLKQLKVAFSPVQDLHGYDSPWPAGGGKNLANVLYGSQVPSITNGQMVAVAGWASDYIPIDSSKEYVISFSGNAGRYLLFYASDKSYLGYDTGFASGTLLSGSPYFENTGYVKVRSEANSTNDPLMQLEVGTTPTSYAPYSNLCPILGWDSLTVEQRGKNLLNLARTSVITSPHSARDFAENQVWVGLSFNNYLNTNRITDYEITDGAITVDCNSVAYGVAFPISCKPNTAYIVSWESESANAAVGIGYYKKDGTYISYTGTSTNVRTVTTPNECEWFTVCFAPNAIDVAAPYSNIQLELGSTASEYQPFNPLSRSISISLGQTVYSGTVDVVTGVVTVTMASSDLGSFNWQSSSASVGRAVETTTAPAKTGVPSNVKANILCSAYKTDVNDNIARGITGICVNRFGYIKIQDASFIGMTFTEIKAALTGVQAVYELAEPIPIQLTPQEVESLAGDNTLWSDANQPLTVTYRSN